MTLKERIAEVIDPLPFARERQGYERQYGTTYQELSDATRRKSALAKAEKIMWVIGQVAPLPDPDHQLSDILRKVAATEGREVFRAAADRLDILASRIEVLTKAH